MPVVPAGLVPVTWLVLTSVTIAEARSSSAWRTVGMSTLAISMSAWSEPDVGRSVEPAVVHLASDDEAVDTAVVSFFDVDYVRSGEEKQVYGEKARERLINRQSANAVTGFIRK